MSIYMPTGSKCMTVYNIGMNFTHITFAVLAGILPSLLWLWFWLREDNLHPEPRSVVARAFIAGMTAMILVLPFQLFVEQYINDTTPKYILWAFIEEVMKLLVVYLVAWRTRELDEPIDDIIYIITCALGFAALENTFYILNIISKGDIFNSIVTANMRFIGATLVHVVSSACIGYMAARTYYMRNILRAFWITVGVVLATAFHSFFNLNVLSGDLVSKMKIFVYVWVCVVVILLLFEKIKLLKPRNSQNTESAVN
jgi:RsiW-degrading membrane proteinase PrsW (M82 family)